MCFKLLSLRLRKLLLLYMTICYSKSDRNTRVYRLKLLTFILAGYEVPLQQRISNTGSRSDWQHIC